MGDCETAPLVREAPTQQQVSANDRTGSTGRTAATSRGRYVLQSSPAAPQYLLKMPKVCHCRMGALLERVQGVSVLDDETAPCSRCTLRTLHLTTMTPVR